MTTKNFPTKLFPEQCVGCMSSRSGNIFQFAIIIASLEVRVLVSVQYAHDLSVFICTEYNIPKITL